MACGERDGIVGVQPLGVAGGSDVAGTAGSAGASAASAGSAGMAGAMAAGGSAAEQAGAAGEAGAAGTPALLGFSEEFVENAAIWDELPKLPGASTTFGIQDSRARDGNLAELRFPGHPEYAGSERVGPAFGTELDTRQSFHFGTYRTRMGFGSCSANEETVMAFLGYFSDGQDRDGDGIVDEMLITFQVLCGSPSRVYLTVFTDYEETPALRFRKLSRVIDFATGTRADTPATDANGYGPMTTDAALAIPTLFTPGDLVEIGFEWHRDSLRFFLTEDGSDRELWAISGADRIPQQPIHIVYHAWHTDTHWYPQDTPADFPASDVVMLVDWATFEPE